MGRKGWGADNGGKNFFLVRMGKLKESLAELLGVDGFAAGKVRNRAQRG